MASENGEKSLQEKLREKAQEEIQAAGERKAALEPLRAKMQEAVDAIRKVENLVSEINSVRGGLEFHELIKDAAGSRSVSNRASYLEAQLLREIWSEDRGELPSEITDIREGLGLFETYMNPIAELWEFYAGLEKYVAARAAYHAAIRSAANEEYPLSEAFQTFEGGMNALRSLTWHNSGVVDDLVIIWGMDPEQLDDESAVTVSNALCDFRLGWLEPMAEIEAILEAALDSAVEAAAEENAELREAKAKHDAAKAAFEQVLTRRR